MREFMLTSGFFFEGYRIAEYIGFVSGECVLGTGFLSEFNLQIADILGASNTLFENKLIKAKLIAMDELKKYADELGANAIIGLDIDYTTFSFNVMGVIANGTAVRVEEIVIEDKQPPFSSFATHIEGDEKNKSFPVINYYENLSIRPFRCNFNRIKNWIKIFLYSFNKERLQAINVDIIANTIFGTTYNFPDLNFVNLQVEDDVIETEENYLKIDDNQLKAIESMSININHYIVDGKAHSVNEQYQVPNIPMDQLLMLRKSYGIDIVSDFRDEPSYWICMCGNKNDTKLSKCAMCKRQKGTYAQEKKVRIKRLLPELIQLHSCQEISAYLKNAEQKNADPFPDAVMSEVDKMVQMERLYGNMKDSLISALKKYVSENE